MEPLLLERYKALPKEQQQEVSDFIEFLAAKYQNPKNKLLSLGEKRAMLFGNAKELIHISPEFDTLPDDFEEYI